MKTTLVIDDTVMQRLREEATRSRRTISELVETALRLMLETRPEPPDPLQPLPTWHGGVPLVDISNREALHTAMDQDK
ncbi:MAG: hypothetical protein FJ100_08465 [Deltaproteobacteria bacterium]|nr:hypothetical protein [Deltaproteobacteria bacterium]